MDVSTSALRTTTTMPMPMLKTRYISSRSTLPAFWMNWNTSGTVQPARSNTASTVPGNTRGTLSGNPPPVICAMPRIFTDFISAVTGLR